MERITHRFMKQFKYTYAILFVVSLLVATHLAVSETFKDFILHLGSLEYIGALIVGMLFVSSFTIPIATVGIAILTTNINPLALGLIGGIGAVIGDLIIFKLVKGHLFNELVYLFGAKEVSYIKTFVKSKYISWTLPLIGMLVIASPLPDELGVSLLGLSRMSDTKFIAISFISNAFGILMIASVAKVL